MGNEIEKVRKDVEATGFPTELKVERILHSRAWAVEPHTYFIDRDEGKGREVDLVCRSRAASVHEKLMHSVHYIMSTEVKQSKSHPWVIMCSSRKFLDLQTGILHVEFGLNKVHETVENALLKHPSLGSDLVGRAGYQAFKKKDKTEHPAFLSATLSAVKSTIEQIEMASKENLVNLFESSGKTLRKIVFASSLIIFDGNLFRCYVKEDDELVLERVSWVPYLQHYASEKYSNYRYLVDIVTLSGLDGFLVNLERWKSEALEVVKKEDPDAWD